MVKLIHNIDPDGPASARQQLVLKKLFFYHQLVNGELTRYDYRSGPLHPSLNLSNRFQAVRGVPRANQLAIHIQQSPTDPLGPDDREGPIRFREA